MNLQLKDVFNKKFRRKNTDEHLMAHDRVIQIIGEHRDHKGVEFWDFIITKKSPGNPMSRGGVSKRELLRRYIPLTPLRKKIG